MKDDQILRQFTAGNNTEEVLALVEELGLFLVSVTCWSHKRTPLERILAGFFVSSSFFM